MENEDGVLLLRRIRVTYQLAAPADAGPVVERVHEAHARYCPVYRSLEKAIDITTDYQLKEAS